jgi:hypothetical protein
VASTIQGTTVWQTLHRGTPDGLGRTRFFVPQLGQAMIVLPSGVTCVHLTYVPTDEGQDGGGSSLVSACERLQRGLDLSRRCTPSHDQHP